MRLTLPGQLELPQTGEDMGALAKAKAGEPLRPNVEQKPLDIGLWSDDANQLDLLDMPMFMEPME